MLLSELISQLKPFGDDIIIANGNHALHIIKRDNVIRLERQLFVAPVSTVGEFRQYSETCDLTQEVLLNNFDDDIGVVSLSGRAVLVPHCFLDNWVRATSQKVAC